MKKLAEFTLGLGSKRIFQIAAQTPFAQTNQDLLTEHASRLSGLSVDGQAAI